MKIYQKRLRYLDRSLWLQPEPAGLGIFQRDRQRLQLFEFHQCRCLAWHHGRLDAHRMMSLATWSPRASPAAATARKSGRCRNSILPVIIPMANPRPPLGCPRSRNPFYNVMSNRSWMKNSAPTGKVGTGPTIPSCAAGGKACGAVRWAVRWAPPCPGIGRTLTAKTITRFIQRSAPC